LHLEAGADQFCTLLHELEAEVAPTAGGDGSGVVQTTGEVLESHPPRRLVISWVDPAKAADRTEYSRVTFEIEVVKDAVRLDVFHNELKAGSEMARGISSGWPRVLSGLKSFLETGTGLNLLCAAAQAKVA